MNWLVQCESPIFDITMIPDRYMAIMPHNGCMKNLYFLIVHVIDYLALILSPISEICMKLITDIWWTIISKGWNNKELNPLCAKFFTGNIKHIFTFHVIPLHWYNTGCWNPSSHKTRTYPFYIVNIVAAGVLATEGARTLAAIIST